MENKNEEFSTKHLVYFCNDKTRFQNSFLVKVPVVSVASN